MIARLPVTIAFAEVLEEASGYKVGRGRKPANIAPPYYLLHSITAAYSGAPYADRNEDASFVYQVTPVSGPDPAEPGSFGLADEAEDMADKAREVAYGRHPGTGLWLHPLTVEGTRFIARGPDVEAGGASDQTDAIMSYVQRFRFDLTSA